MASVAHPIRPRPRPRSRSESRPATAPTGRQSFSAHAHAVPTRPPRSLPHPKINIDTQIIQQSTPRRAGNLALQARDSVSMRKRTMSTGAMSARVARQNVRRACKADLLQPSPNGTDASSSNHGRRRSCSPGSAAPNRPSRSPSLSSSSPSQSPTPVTPSNLPLSGAPSSYHARARTHVPHNSQGTTTSAYPPSSSQSSRSSSPSPERSRTPSPSLRPQKSFLHSTPHTPSLDLDPDDVNARLRLLVNNSYFLPPAHTKPSLSPIYLTSTTMKGATSPSAFKDFFRVGKRKEKKPTNVNGYANTGGRPGLPPIDSPQSIPSSDGRYVTLRPGDGYFDLQPDAQMRNRVVVVRETVDDLPPPAVRAPFRTSSLQARVSPRIATETGYIDPTTQYDMPPPSHYPSYTNLHLDAAGLTGNVELDQFAPPGEPWSPAPSSPHSHRGSGGGTGSGSGMDPQERVWRRALLEKAVDLSLSSTGSDPGHISLVTQEGFLTRGGRVLTLDLEPTSPTSPKSPKSKKSWWGRREKDVNDAPRRTSTSSSNRERDTPRNSGLEHPKYVSDIQVRSLPTPQRVIGQCIIPNVHSELQELERERREKELAVGLPPPLRLAPIRPFGVSSVSAPATPLYQHEPPRTPTFSPTALSPRPPCRRIDTKRDVNAFGEHVAREFMPGHSTIKKSLSSPLLSDLHETGVDVEDPMPFPASSSNSLDGVAAPSLVLHDPHGMSSLVPSNTTDSFTSGSHYSDDEQEMFDLTMTPNEQQFGLRDDDGASMERWNTTHSSPGHDDGRPSFDSFGNGRVRSPEGESPARASSTFGYRRSNVSVTNPSPLRGLHQDIEVDISGDPIEHLSMMESRRSVSSSGESQTSSVRGYASALDHTFHSSGAPSIRPSSPASQSFRSTKTRLASIKSQPRPETQAEMETPAPISFFDSVQNQSYMEDDDTDSDADADVDEPPDVQNTTSPDKPLHSQTQTLGRKSLNSTRPTPAFPTQFRNASQPQLPVSRVGGMPHIDSKFHPIQPYDHLDRKKPLTNTPLLASPTASSGILSQFKAKPSKAPHPFSSRSKKKSGVSSVVLPESTFELLNHPRGTTFSSGSNIGTVTGSVCGSALGRFQGVKSQGSLLSLRSSDAGSLQQVDSWRREQIVHNESVKRLDGMVVQHLEAEKDRLRKIASAARENGRNRSRVD